MGSAYRIGREAMEPLETALVGGGKTEETKEQSEQEVKKEPNKKRLVKRGSGGINIRTEELEKVADADTIYSDLSARQRDVKNALRQISWGLNGVRKSRGDTLGKNSVVVVHETPEPFVNKGKQGKRAVRY